MLDMARADIDQDTLARLVRNAMLLRAQGDQDRAQIALEFVAANSIRVLGEDHPDTLGALMLLADTMRTRGELQPAREIEEVL